MLPWKQADSVHLNTLLRQQLPSGVIAETNRSVEALGRGRGYTLFLQCGVQKSWGGRGKGSSDSLVSQLSQQGLKRVNHLGREMLARACFSAQPVCVCLLCWAMERPCRLLGLFAAVCVQPWALARAGCLRVAEAQQREPLE